MKIHLNILKVKDYEGDRLLCSTFSSDGTKLFVGGLKGFIFNFIIQGIYCYDTNTFQLNFKIPVESGIVWKLLYLK
jgi:hypothetical protein